MTKTRRCEAVWTLEEGPLEKESEAAALFAAVGEIVDVEPVRYDLNRRGKWRPYRGPALMVDVLTQRTQLVTIAEDEEVDRGGVEVVLATGKQGRPPQAVARWIQRWPPERSTVERWERGALGAFDGLRLRSFVLRVDDAARLAATVDRRHRDELRALVAEPRRALVEGKVRGWSSLGDG